MHEAEKIPRSQTARKLAANARRALATYDQWSAPERREQQRAIMQTYWQQEEFRERVWQRRWGEGRQQRQREKLKEHWQSPAFRNKMRRGQISAWTLERRRKHSEAMRRYWAARRAQQAQQQEEV